MKDLKDKVFWITGASSGIGEATALEAATKGAKLVISARRKEELDRVKVATSLSDKDILVLPLDMLNHESFPHAIETILEKFGRIDILFNNAGTSQRSSVIETTYEVFAKLIDLNYLSVVALTKAVLPVMVKQNSGTLVVTSSISGKLGSPMRAGYCGSKHALHGFFDALRSEVYKYNIDVLIVCPGYIKTEISKNAFASDGSKYGKMDDNQNYGISADVCASKIIKGIESNKNEIYIARKELLGVYLKRLWPGLLNRIVRKQAPK